MAEHERINTSSRREGPWSVGSAGVLDACPDGDLAIDRYLRRLELDLRLISLDLWALGWTPYELLADVRRSTGCVDATSLMVRLLLADDLCRSEQARPPAWRNQIAELSVQTGIADLGVGWLTAWMVEQSSARQASECLQAVMIALDRLIGPSAA